MAYDLIIKSGTVIDGTGKAPILADIGIKGEEIAAVEDLKNAAAKTVINAYGKYVTPGFIDITNHSDTHLTLFKYPLQESMVMQGVTTIIGGNCGASLAPLASREAIHAIKKWADPSQINTDWATVDEFLASLANMRLGINFGTLVGFGTLRRGVIGDAIQPLNSEERATLRHLLQEGVEQGAFGFSLGLAYGHERISSTEEILDVVKVLPPLQSIAKLHLRSEGYNLLASVNEAVRIAREGEITVQISHFKGIGKKAWPSVPRALELIARAKESGIEIDFDVSPYGTTGSSLYLLIPAWAREGGFKELFRRIDNREERAKIFEGLRGITLHYDSILVTSAKVKTIVGQTIAQIAESGGLSPEEALVETVRANEGRVSIVGKTVSFKNTKIALQDENSLVASDGVGISQDEIRSGDMPHPRSFGAFPRFLGKFVSELNIPIGKAIYKITGGPAKKLRLKDRGVLAPKYAADIVIFDPRLIRDRATYKNPFRYPAGIETVIVNGKVAVEQGRHTGVRAGKILRKQ